MTTRQCRKIIYEYYADHRRELPWRGVKDPYKILISEVMLQQTQVASVLPKYRLFLKKFPNFKTLAQASFKNIFAVWQGLGYNRRPLALRRLARIVLKDHGGKLPRSVEKLEQLPGIGRATASALCAFAWNMPTVFIETNIRTVFMHCFFPHCDFVSDRELLSVIEKTLDQKNPREWYYALMDYGVMLKKRRKAFSGEHPEKRKARPFKGSNREARGKVLKTLLLAPQTEANLARARGDKTKVKKAIAELHRENLIRRTGRRYALV